MSLLHRNVLAAVRLGTGSEPDGRHDGVYDGVMPSAPRASLDAVNASTSTLARRPAPHATKKGADRAKQRAAWQRR